MKRLKVLPAAFLAAAVMAASVILGACSGGGGSAGAPPAATTKIQLSGTIASGGSYTFGKGTYGKTYYGAQSSISKAVAVPMNRGSLDARNMGSRMSGNIGTDGKFGLELPTDQDWVLAITDSADGFVGSIAISAGSESIISLPATAATLTVISLGTMTGSGGDVVSSPAVTAANFGMNGSQFTALVSADDVFKNVKNIINNYNTATGVWYQLRPDFTWYGDYATIKTTYSGASWSYHHYTFQMDTNSTSLTIQDLCTNGTGSFTLAKWTPPTTISVVGTGGTPSVKYSDTIPITNSTATCTIYQSDNGPAWSASNPTGGGGFYASNAYAGAQQTLSYSIQEWFAGSIPSGDWTWTEGVTEKARFDPSVSAPLAADGIRATGYVPSIKLTLVTEGTGTTETITAVDVQWYFFDGSTYQLVPTADLGVMAHVMSNAEVIITTGINLPYRQGSFSFDPTIPAEQHVTLPTCAADPLNCWTYADLSAATPFRSTDAGAIGVAYSSGGIGRNFWAFAPY